MGGGVGVALLSNVRHKGIYHLKWFGFWSETGVHFDHYVPFRSGIVFSRTRKRNGVGVMV